jgi:2-polyprenyl-3-methyl-5-hydroxy-6-metoxy-1,4-benzoquinol methylase
MFHKRIIAPEWEETLFSKWMSRAAIEEFEERVGANSTRNRFEKGRTNTRHVLRLDKLTSALRTNDPMRILDFGCGWGDFLSAATRFGAEAYGIDADPDRRRAGGEKDLIVFPSLGEMDSNLRGTFHVVTLFQVLEHLPAPLSILEELAEWLMPGGILILETPDCAGVSDVRTLEDYRAINPLSHINAFTPKSLEAIARQAGFCPIFPGVAHATTSPVQVVKTEIKRIIGRFLPATTDQYFRCG